MNLTYEHYYHETVANPEKCAGCHAIAARAAVAVKKSGTKNSQELGGLFSKVVESVKRTALHPLEVLKAGPDPRKVLDVYKQEGQAAKGDVIAFAPIVGPVAQLFPGIGTAIGAGALLLSARFKAEAAQKKSALQSKQGDNAAIIQEYQQYAGQTPGRFFGTDVLKQVLNAAFDKGAIPAAPIGGGKTKVWANMAADFMDANGGKCATSNYNCPPGLIPLARSMPGASAAQVVDAYAASNPVHAPDLRGGLERQIFMDIADAALAEGDPNAPFTYGVNAGDYEQPQAAPTPPTALVQSAPANVAPILTSAPPSQFIPRAVAPAKAAPSTVQLIGADNSRAVSDMLAAMQAQGASQAQMMQQAMNSLAARGVDTSKPQVIESMKAEVAQTGNTNYLPWILGGVGLLGVVFLLKGRKKR